MQLPSQLFAEVLECLQHWQMPDASEKRRSPRLRVETKISAMRATEAAEHKAYTALTRDISFMGLGLMQSIEMAKGDQFIVMFPRTKRPPVFVRCTVMHVKTLADGLFGIGAQFTELVESPLASPQ